MQGFNLTIKGVRYELRPYKEFRDEWDLIVSDQGIVCDSKPYFTCLHKFLSMIED